MYIVLAILVFSVLIVLHELGHFLAAKACGVQVNEFSIFMGPKLLQFKGKETLYTLRLVPLGGFCAMEGEDEDNGNPRAFTAAKWWKRLIILVAGSFMNFLAGLLVVFCLYGNAEAFVEPVVIDFLEGCPYVSEEGFQAGDRIHSIDGNRVYLYSDLEMFLERNAEQVYDLVLIRDGEQVNVEDFSLKKIEYEGEASPMYGFYFGTTEATFGAKLKNMWYHGIDFARLVWLGLGDLVNGRAGVKDMSGPVGIVSVISDTGNEAETTAAGVVNVLYLGAFIAVNLAVMNMLPIPALDGGRVFFLLITTVVQAVTKKTINPKYEGYIHAAGMLLLLAIMALITLKDVWMLFAR